MYIGARQFPRPRDNLLGEMAQWLLSFCFIAVLLIQLDIGATTEAWDDEIFDWALVLLLPIFVCLYILIVVGQSQRSKFKAAETNPLMLEGDDKTAVIDNLHGLNTKLESDNKKLKSELAKLKGSKTVETTGKTIKASRSRPNGKTIKESRSRADKKSMSADNIV
jgi:hypothetical protein